MVFYTIRLKLIPAKFKPNAGACAFTEGKRKLESGVVFYTIQLKLIPVKFKPNAGACAFTKGNVQTSMMFEQVQARERGGILHYSAKAYPRSLLCFVSCDKTVDCLFHRLFDNLLLLLEEGRNVGVVFFAEGLE